MRINGAWAEHQLGSDFLRGLAIRDTYGDCELLRREPAGTPWLRRDLTRRA